MIKIFKKSKTSIGNLVEILQKGGIIALPTETAYGLATDATSSSSVNKLSQIKGRGSHKPIAVIVGDIKSVKRYFYLTSDSLKIADKFWPGPLTILLRPRRKFPKKIVGFENLVGVRVPGDKWLRNLLVTFGKPLTATSANLSGKPTLYDSRLVKKFMKNTGLTYMVDAGKLLRRPTSTVVKCNDGKIEILRLGGVSVKKLNSMLR